LHESQKLAAAIGALLLGHQSGTSQPAGRLLLQAWISCARSVAMRTEDRVIPDLLCGRDEHLVRDTEAPELRRRQGTAATHRAASVAMQL
jgi:hypothetical protein